MLCFYNLNVALSGAEALHNPRSRVEMSYEKFYKALQRHILCRYNHLNKELVKTFETRKFCIRFCATTPESVMDNF